MQYKNYMGSVKYSEADRVICKNSIGKSVLAENKDLHSTKVSGAEHGYGHIIINKIVADYNGMVDYFEEEGMFGIQVILPRLVYLHHLKPLQNFKKHTKMM